MTRMCAQEHACQGIVIVLDYVWQDIALRGQRISRCSAPKSTYMSALGSLSTLPSTYVLDGYELRELKHFRWGPWGRGNSTHLVLLLFQLWCVSGDATSNKCGQGAGAGAEAGKWGAGEEVDNPERERGREREIGREGGREIESGPSASSKDKNK
jgi:hypothetical protein